MKSGENATGFNAIKNSIVDKIITITVVFIAPTFVAFVYRLITDGWGHLFLFTIN